VKRFAELLDALLFTPSRNGKLRLMQEYFATTPDPERGWALAALTGELSFAEAKPSQVRDLAMARVDPELFGWSWDFVGDLAETVALIWPEPEMQDQSAVPSLSEIVSTLQGASRADVGAHLAPWLDALDATGRWALLKLVTGALRIGVSARLAKTALAEAREQRCTACYVLLRPQKWNEIKAAGEVMTCDSCGRILFYDPSHEPPPPEPDKKRAKKAKATPEAEVPSESVIVTIPPVPGALLNGVQRASLKEFLYSRM